MQTPDVLEFMRAQRASLDEFIAALEASTPTPTPTPVPTPAPIGSYDIASVAQFQDAVTNGKPGAEYAIKADLPAMKVYNARPAGGVTVRDDRSHVVEGIDLFGCANLAFDGLLVVPKGAVVPEGKAIPSLINGDAATSDIEITNSDFLGALTAPADFMAWDASDWHRQQTSAVLMLGNRITLRGNAAVGIYHGFTVQGADCVMADLRVAGHSGDAFRGCADTSVYRRLWSTSAMVFNLNHPDAFQMFRTGAALTDALVEDCIFMEWVGATDRRKCPASLQIIGAHNGPYNDFTFRRIVGATSSLNAYHLNNCPTSIHDKVAIWGISGPKGGVSKFRVPAGASVNQVYLDKTVKGSAPATGAPDYKKLPTFQATEALRGNVMPDISAIMGW